MSAMSLEKTRNPVHDSVRNNLHGGSEIRDAHRASVCMAIENPSGPDWERTVYDGIWPRRCGERWWPLRPWQLGLTNRQAPPVVVPPAKGPTSKRDSTWRLWFFDLEWCSPYLYRIFRYSQPYEVHRRDFYWLWSTRVECQSQLQ